MQCENCKGTGKQWCIGCDGNGIHAGGTCPECGGTGEMLCKKCKGIGVLYQ